MNENWHEWLQGIAVSGLAAAYRKASPTHYFTIDDFLPPDFARELAAAYPTLGAARDLADTGAGKRFERVNEDEKVQITDPSEFPEPVALLNDLLASREFIDVLEQITGIEGLLPDPELTGGGMHIMGRSGNLGVHLDFNYLPHKDLYRRLNLLVYLTPDWEPSWGGEFDLWDTEVNKCLKVIEPRFNRCASFNTTTESFHGVREVRCPDGVTRNTFAVFYYTKERPREFEGAPFSTIYRPRPGEWRKRFFGMPLEWLRQAPRRARMGLRRRLRGRSE